MSVCVRERRERERERERERFEPLKITSERGLGLKKKRMGRGILFIEAVFLSAH